MPGTRTRSNEASAGSGFSPPISMPHSVRTRSLPRALKTVVAKRGPSAGVRMSLSTCATCSASAGPEMLESMQPSIASRPRWKVDLVIDHHRAHVAGEPFEHDLGNLQRGTLRGAAARLETEPVGEVVRQRGRRWRDELESSCGVAADEPHALRYVGLPAAVLGASHDIDLGALERREMPTLRGLIERGRVLTLIEIDREVGGGRAGSDDKRSGERN